MGFEARIHVSSRRTRGTSLAIVSPILSRADSAWNDAPKVTCPMVGANCRRIVDKYSVGGPSGVGRMGCETSDVPGAVSTSLPRFRSDCGDRILLLLAT